MLSCLEQYYYSPGKGINVMAIKQNESEVKKYDFLFFSAFSIKGVLFRL